MFVPKHPETMARIERLDQAESALDVSRLVEAAVRETTSEKVHADFRELRIADCGFRIAD